MSTERGIPMISSHVMFKYLVTALGYNILLTCTALSVNISIYDDTSPSGKFGY